MACLNARASAGRLRVYKHDVYDDGSPPYKEQEQDSALLVDKIQHHYKEAGDRLTVRWRSDILPRFLNEGICIGLLDPPSNIIANTLLAATAPVSRAEALVAVVDGTADIERRSLDGLVAFLTCFFPYLDDWEAVRYLLHAEADPLVAARLVASDRGNKTFLSGSAATDGALKLALRCATLAAKHPRAAQLADTWLSLSPTLLDKVVSLLSAVQRDFPRDILHSFHNLVKETPAPPPTALIWPWELAAGRNRLNKLTYPSLMSLRRVLLDMIHGFYLQALAWMPTGELRSRYHRSLLEAGHCYGPFDPVSNIILNTIWYEAAFRPTTPEYELDMVGTLSLLRIEARSFYGLVSFLCTRHHDLSVHQALLRLLDTNLNLHEQQQPPCSSVVQEEEEAAFRAAAIAAWHPKPDAQVEFLSSCKAMLLPAGLSPQLSSDDVCHLASLLRPKSPSQCMSTQQQPHSICIRRFHDLMAHGNNQRMAHTRISRKVKAALRRYENQNSEPSCYQLHVICGVNELVSGPDYCEGSSLKKKIFSDCRTADGAYYHHTHANFLVTRNVGSKASVPILFFAELSNDNNDDEDSQHWCCPVDFPPPCAEPVRCLFCEHEGIRIVHPAGENFHGRDVEFEKMIRGEDLYDEDYDPSACDQVYTNHRMLRHSELVASWVEGLNEDCMYLHEDDFTIDEDDDGQDFSDGD